MMVTRTLTILSQHGDSTGLDMSALIHLQSASSEAWGHPVTSQAFDNCLLFMQKFIGDPSV